ncbi:MAG: argininosuccinate lyase [Candidatus Pelagibacter sp. TMED272]|nr:argininosuccinate lyase [Pelagibacteraceae bacterium]RPG93681.1 MAG: argininosuccinate lyase [Candidatus Pelagibacter sp. TMED272]|tara:strand:+ start:4954 stop:6342 length:1389 start_codon:yes stop_codon:yes gene_type:complete
MKNKNKTVWSNRFKGKTSASFQKIGSSITVDKRLYEQDIAASIVHAKMLMRQKIIGSKDGTKIINGLKKIKSQIDRGQFKFQEKFEDIHLNIENKLVNIIGSSAGYLHTARSRNDQVVTDFKLWTKKSSREIIKNIYSMMKSLIKKAEKNTDTIMPGLTHLKNAQTISFAHYLLSYYEMFKRDVKRFENNIKLLDECPLGSAALAGTSYKIDRNYTSKHLGFKKPTDNSLDSVADRDFAVDFLYASALCAMHLSRLAEDFIIYNSNAFDLISFDDSMLTGSSIMPQKKNPDPAEFIRGRVGLNYGNLNSMLTIMKGLPMSYFKDLQDDKKLVFDGFDALNDSLLLSVELINSVRPNKKNMLKMANKGYTTATDFADYLVKEKKLSFRESYAIAAKLVNFAEKKNKFLGELSLQEIKKIYKDLDNKVLKIFNVSNSMNSKRSYGGTSITNVKMMIKKYKKEIK